MGLAGAGMMLIGGCGTTRSASAMPGPVWRPRAGLSQPSVTSSQQPAESAPSGLPGVISRSRWTSAPPSPSNMNRQSPIHSITVHHDGMRPYFGNDEGSTVGRLETIRRSHRERQNWGDIGYHFAVDRSGRVYECRALIWQGAHVKDHNPGNIGVLALGNFDEQSPTDAQLESVRSFVIQLQQTYNVPANRVLTHREWPGAVTACPGRALQSYMDTIRARRMLA